MKKTGAGILYTDGKTVLLLYRSEYVKAHSFTWAPTGGSIEDGEDLLEAAKRESLEEIGVFKGKQIAEFPQDKFAMFRQNGLHLKMLKIMIYILISKKNGPNIFGPLRNTIIHLTNGLRKTRTLIAFFPDTRPAFCHLECANFFNSSITLISLIIIANHPKLLVCQYRLCAKHN